MMLIFFLLTATLCLASAVFFRIESHPDADWVLSTSSNTCSITDTIDSCDLPVKGDSTFTVDAVPTTNDGDFQPLQMYGYYMQDGPYNYTTYTGNRKQLVAVLKMLDIDYDKEDKGILVVGLDISSDSSNGPHTLVPAIGAKVTSLSGVTMTDEGFIYKGVSPQFGQEIIDGGSSFVTFANVPQGKEFKVMIEAPTGMQCALGPAGVVDNNVNNEATTVCQPDTISVVSFICA
jgi:hypothetical protein